MLTWTAPSDATASSTYNVYRANTVCPTSGPLSGATKVNAAAITALTFTDNTITVGNWCYYVTQVQAGIESGQSNTAGGQARPGIVTIQIVIT